MDDGRTLPAAGGGQAPGDANNMAPMRATRLATLLACLAALGAAAGGCGGGSDGETGDAAAASRPAPPKSDFPSADGRTLGEVVKLADRPTELVVSPAALAFTKGVNRYPFGVFTRDQKQVPDAEVALYFAKVPPAGGGGGPEGKGPKARAQKEALHQRAIGPFPARIESLETKPAFRAKTTVDDPDAATVVYSAPIDFPSEGEWRIAALIKEGDQLGGTLLPSAVVGKFKRIPRPGDRAPRIHTPTPADAGGDASEITTRVPPDTQNRVDFADVLGRKPIILLFATPQFCQSRVCGPVVDVAEQAKEESRGEAQFIHMEIFNDNDPNKGVRPQVRAYHLPTEPWLFAIDRRGIVRAAVEGAFGLELMRDAIRKAERG